MPFSDRLVILKEASLLAGIGLASGLAGSVQVGRSMRATLYGVGDGFLGDRLGGRDLVCYSFVYFVSTGAAGGED